MPHATVHLSSGIKIPDVRLTTYAIRTKASHFGGTNKSLFPFEDGRAFSFT